MAYVRASVSTRLKPRTFSGTFLPPSEEAQILNSPGPSASYFAPVQTPKLQEIGTSVDQRVRLNKMLSEARSITKNVSQLSASPMRRSAGAVADSRSGSRVGSPRNGGSPSPRVDRIIQGEEYEGALSHASYFTGDGVGQYQCSNRHGSPSLSALSQASEREDKLVDHIKDLNLSHKMEVLRLREENKKLHEKYDRAKVRLAEVNYSRTRHVAEDRVEWEKAEAVNRQAFRKHLLSEFEKRERELAQLYETKLKNAIFTEKKIIQEQRESEDVVRRQFEEKEVGFALQEQKMKLTKRFTEQLSKLREEMQHIIVQNKAQEKSLQVLNEWKKNCFDKLNVFSATFHKLHEDIHVLERRHPANVELLEKKYEVELNDLSVELNKKIQSWNSVRKPFDEKYFLKKQMERTVHTTHRESPEGFQDDLRFDQDDERRSRARQYRAMEEL
jgi:hypothetical protein